MTRRSRAAVTDDTPETTQDAPTALPPRDESGFELDNWGLPIVGPVRAARLAELGKPDPNIDPDAWSKAAAPTTDGGDASNEELSNG